MKHPSNIHILIVEDDVNDLELTLRGMRKLGPTVNAMGLHDGEEAVEFLLAQGRYAERQGITPPLLVLLDLKLPKVNGLEVLKRVRAETHVAAVPIVMLTSSQEPRDVRDSYALGANSYVVKPGTFEAYVATIEQVADYWTRVNLSVRD